MINSNQMCYTIISSILMTVLLFPSFNIKAQDEGEESDPLTLISNIKNLLDKSMTEVKAGNYTGASDLIDVAYIDNYEYIEDPLKELDADLMEETEVMIREDLAGAIEDEKPLAEITLLYNNSKANLEKAEQLFKQ